MTTPQQQAQEAMRALIAKVEAEGSAYCAQELEDAKARLDRAAVGTGIQAEHAEGPVGHGRRARDHPHGRRLAGTVRTKKTERFARRHVKVY